jgi:hypothetical protein
MKVLKVIAGVLLMPIFLALFVWDRIITIPLVWIPTSSLMDWFRDNEKMVNSVIRGGIVGLIVISLWFIF